MHHSEFVKYTAFLWFLQNKSLGMRKKKIKNAKKFCELTFPLFSCFGASSRNNYFLVFLFSYLIFETINCKPLKIANIIYESWCLIIFYSKTILNKAILWVFKCYTWLHLKTTFQVLLHFMLDKWKTHRIMNRYIVLRLKLIDINHVWEERRLILRT